MVKTEYIRDGKNQIIANLTTGLATADTVVREASGRILGHSNSVFNNTRDSQGRLVSRNSDNSGLLLRK
jgi:hypothetical protein